MRAQSFGEVARIFAGLLLLGVLVAAQAPPSIAGNINKAAQATPLLLYAGGGYPGGPPGGAGGYGGGPLPGNDDPFPPGGFDPDNYDDPFEGDGGDLNGDAGLPRRQDQPDDSSNGSEEYLVLLAQGEDPSILPGFGATVQRSFFVDLFGRPVYVVTITDDPLAQSLSLLEMELSPQVEVVQPNYDYTLSWNDPLAPWRENETPRAPSGNKVQQATAQREVTVAVIDTTVDDAHPALAGVKIERYDHTGAPSQEAGGVHGTAMVSLIVGRSPVDGAGAPARVLSFSAFKVDGANPNLGSSSTELVLQSVNAAAQFGIDILSMSFENSKRELLLPMALSAVVSSGVVAVAAAGNGGPSAPAAYPAAYDQVLAISAVDKSGNLYSHANRGPYIFAATLGVQVKVAVPGAGYATKSGTSMAAAYFAGICARLLALRPDLAADQVADLIRATAYDSGPPGWDSSYGHGRIDLEDSLASANGG